MPLLDENRTIPILPCAYFGAGRVLLVVCISFYPYFVLTEQSRRDKNMGRKRVREAFSVPLGTQYKQPIKVYHTLSDLQFFENLANP